METNNTQDAKSLVFDGRAGTGAAFILQNAWQKGIDLQRHYDDQDARRAQQQAQYAQQNKLLATRDKQAAEKAAHQERADFLKDFDPSKAAPQDQQLLAQRWNDDVLQPTAASFAEGKNPFLPQNAVAGAAIRDKKARIMALVNASVQRNAELGENIKTIHADSEGLYGSGADYMEKVKAWSALPIEERATTPPPSLDAAVIPDKVAANIVSRIKLSKRTDAQRNGLQTTETTDEAITPQNRMAAVDELLAMPGIKRKFQNEYEALAGSQRPASLDEYLHNRAEALVRNHEVSNHDEKIVFQQPRFQWGEHAHYQRVDKQRQVGATNLLMDWQHLRSGSTDLYKQPVAIGGRSYLRSDKFDGYTAGTYNGKPNQVRGVYRDGAGAIYLATDATNGRPVPLSDADVFDKLLMPIWTGNNYKGHPEVLQEVAHKFFKPGTNVLDTSSLGNANTPAHEQDARDVLHRNQRYTDVLHQQMAELAAAINPNSSATVTHRGKSYAQAEIETATLSAQLKRGRLVINGYTYQNPQVVLVRGKEDGSRTLAIAYDVANKKGEIERRHQTLTPARLAEAMKGFVPKEEHLRKPNATPSTGPAPGTPPAPGAVEQATTGGKVNMAGRSGKKRDLLNLNGDKPTKRDVLGLNGPAVAPTPSYRFKPGTGGAY